MIYLFLGLITLIVVIDRWSKNRALIELEDVNSVKVIKGRLQLILVKNEGAAFNILTGKLELIVKATLVLIVCALIYLIQLVESGGSIAVKLALSFIIGGGVGNLIDRLGYGYVIDFIHIKGYKTPVFNVADIFIFIGALSLMLNISKV